MRSCCSRRCCERAPGLPCRPLRLRPVLLERHKYSAGPAPSSTSCWSWSRAIVSYRTLLRHGHGGARRTCNGRHALSGAAARCAAGFPDAADLHLSIAHSLKTLGRSDRCHRVLPGAAAARPDFGDAYWSLANLKTYRFTRRGARAHARCGGGACDPARSTAITCASRSARRSRTAATTASRWRYYERGNELQRAAEPLPSGSDRAQHREAEGGLHAGILRRSARAAASPSADADLHRRTAALRLDADRADPRLALAGRGHAGARRHPAHRARVAGPRARSRVAALSRRARAAPRRGFRAARRAAI